MKLEWMGKHREIIEKTIRYGNVYAAVTTRRKKLGTEEALSAQELQTIEYVLEDENQKMTEIAKRLGISTSLFSKHVNKMCKRGFLVKVKKPDNKKDIYLSITPKGMDHYNHYSNYVRDNIFAELFTVLDQIPPEFELLFCKYLDLSADALEGI